MSDPKRARCFDPDWRYTPHEATDIRKLFAKVRRQQKAEAEAAAKPANVKQLRKAKG